jgi:hypothetical protein
MDGVGKGEEALKQSGGENVLWENIESQDCAVLTQLVWLQAKVKIFDVDSCPHLD